MNNAINQHRRKDDGLRSVLPYITTVLMFIMTSMVGTLSFFYKEDRKQTRELIASAMETIKEIRQDMNRRFEDNYKERVRLIEKHEDEKVQVKRELSELRYSCCSERRGRF